MTFFWPHAFWLLFVPFGIACFDLLRRRKATLNPHPKIVRGEAGPHALSIENTATAATPLHRHLRWRWVAGTTFAIVALARPQWGRLEEPLFDQSREIVIALDLSKSMRATDVKPSRLERARLLITSLLERLAGERVGLVVFSGTAFLQCPLSADYEILRDFLPSLDTNYLPEGGTNYAALLETSLSAFGSSQSADRFLIILSDGEALSDDWRQAANQLKTRGIRVIALGIGTREGSMLPDGSGGYIKDERGAVVLSKLDSSTLQELANLTSGVYADASGWVDLAELLQSTVEAGRKGEFREPSRIRLAERFQWALFPALLFLWWSYCSEFPVKPRLREIKLARKPSPTAPAVAAVGLLVLLLTLAPNLRAALPNIAANEPTPDVYSAPLSQLAKDLSGRPSVEAGDWKSFAETTLDYARRSQGASQRISERAIRDGIEATDTGEALQPRAADWSALRGDLRKYLQNPEPPPQQSPNQQQQDQQQRQDQKNQDSRSQSSQDQKSSQSQQQKQDRPSQSDSQRTPEQKGGTGEQKSEGQSAFGDMHQKTPPPPARKPDPSNVQTVGGNTDRREPTNPADPTLLVPLQKLDQLKRQDSPAVLYELMRNDQPTPPKTGKDW